MFRVGHLVVDYGVGAVFLGCRAFRRVFRRGARRGLVVGRGVWGGHILFEGLSLSLRGGGGRSVRSVGGEASVHGCTSERMASRLLGDLLRRTVHAPAVKGLRLCDMIMAHDRRKGGTLTPTRFGRPVIANTPIMLAVYTSCHHAAL